MDRDNVYYVKGKGFLVGAPSGRPATDKEIGHALRTGRLYNTSSLRLVNDLFKENR